MSSYDAFAWLYDRYWAAPLQQWEMPALDRLLLNHLPMASHILDLCCGTGHLARELVRRKFLVTGIDNSAGMLEMARMNVPEGATFLLQNASNFQLPQPVDAALCTFDSINHLLDREQVLASFLQISRALKPGGRFVFDVNTPAAYREQWSQVANVIEPDHVFFLRGHYDPHARRGHTELTIFRLTGPAWQRTDVQFQQRPWEIPELTALLHQAGFREIEHWRAAEDLQREGPYSTGRCYVRAVNGPRSV